ncbi:TlyA family RNA methyltransferase [Alloscardovia theropitheci]|uniref:TlyA family RNA methyltransferase n=1 Tax=Alloscardovia theropitheci TaxID=2496842 RepID=A0A4R0QVT6_9BIFI|nr:TlyA family RNA methyltransferase [Alloscardovia theropitheci]TCD53570.1 TlyA family RNA methyltransferase [Alloscardovia theropitheci]
MQRLDKELVRRGLAPTRSRAQQLIDSHVVLVNGTNERIKASLSVDDNDDITLNHATRSSGQYVSRGAIKLIEALELFMPEGEWDIEGKNCLDIGASTGGFTQVLLEKGAHSVIALDVGHNQLDPIVKNDNRVIDMSGVNIRHVEAENLPFMPQVVVSDVSFISLTYVIPTISRITHSGANAVLLIKPQFEVGRNKLGKGGIVTEEKYRREAIEKVTQCATLYQFDVKGVVPSAITGTHGNQEYLLWITRV